MAKPAISDVELGPGGRRFTLTFEPLQELPPHRNHAKVEITATRGAGVLTVDAATRELVAGGVATLAPGVEHSVVAGAEVSNCGYN